MSDKVIVSKEKLDNLADSVKTLSNSSDNLTLEEMQSAVEAKTEKGFELIEKFVLTEDVNTVQRTKEPDGTPYNFEELFVRITFPDRQNLTENMTLSALVVGCYTNNLDHIVYPSLYTGSVSLTTSYLTRINIVDNYFRIYKNLLLANGANGRTAEAIYATYPINRLGAFVSKKSKITGFSANMPSTKFPAIVSPTFQIYGVRA